MPKNKNAEVELEVGFDDDNFAGDDAGADMFMDMSMDLDEIEGATDPETHVAGRYRVGISRAVAGHTRTAEDADGSPYPPAKYPGLPRLTVTYRVTGGKGHNDNTLYVPITDMNQSYIVLPVPAAREIMPKEVFMKAVLKVQHFCTAFKLPLKTFMNEASKLNYFADSPELASFLVDMETNAVIGVKDAQGDKENFIREWS